MLVITKTYIHLGKSSEKIFLILVKEFKAFFEHLKCTGWETSPSGLLNVNGTKMVQSHFAQI